MASVGSSGYTSWASSAAARRVMQGNRSRDTTPERQIRSALHVMGYRYRVAARPLSDLPRTADMVFRSRRVAVFVDGCYWHGCPEHYNEPTTNASYWRQKIRRNRERDADTDQRLLAEGWSPVRVWEHEPIEVGVARVVAVLRQADTGREA